MTVNRCEVITDDWGTCGKIAVVDLGERTRLGSMVSKVRYLCAEHDHFYRQPTRARHERKLKGQNHE